MKSDLREVKVYIICDPQLVGYHPKIDHISEVMRQLIPPGNKLMIKETELESLEHKQDPDILILDYDEFSGVRSSLTQLEMAQEWAKENPDKLLILWSRFLGVLADQKGFWRYRDNIVVKANYDDREFFEQVNEWLMPVAAVL